jgi:hypothetical protein
MLDKKYIRSIRAALADKGLEEQKESLVHQYTDGRTTHVSDMSTAEALALLAELNKGKSQEDGRKKMIRLCYSLGYQIGMVDAAGKLDKTRFNALIERLSPQHKALGDHNYEEMKMLCTLFRKYYNERLKNKEYHNEEVQT